MTKLIIIIFFLFIPNISSANNWSKEDTLREVAWQTIHFMDWGQTLEIARQPDRYHELNPILGRHPSVGEVNTYMALSAIGHITISYLLPKKIELLGTKVHPRAIWQYISIGISSACVINNFNVGLKIKF